MKTITIFDILGTPLEYEGDADITTELLESAKASFLDCRGLDARPEAFSLQKVVCGDGEFWICEFNYTDNMTLWREGGDDDLDKLFETCDPSLVEGDWENEWNSDGEIA